MSKSNQHSLSQSLEAAIALWEQHLNEFTVLLSDAIPSIKNADWSIEKKRVFVCESDISKKRRRTASGPSYHSRVSLNRSDTEQIWHRFQAFAGSIGLDEVERIPANEQELGQYDFRASNSQTSDSFTCLIYLPGEWNQAGVHISVFIGPRYREADLDIRSNYDGKNLPQPRHK